MESFKEGKGPEAGTPHKDQEAPGQNKTVTVIINGREKEIQGKKISFEEVVTKAFGSYEDRETMIYTVTYSKGEGKKEGTMVKGDTVPIKNEMEFVVTMTDKS